MGDISLIRKREDQSFLERDFRKEEVVYMV